MERTARTVAPNTATATTALLVSLLLLPLVSIPVFVSLLVVTFSLTGAGVLVEALLVVVVVVGALVVVVVVGAVFSAGFGCSLS